MSRYIFLQKLRNTIYRSLRYNILISPSLGEGGEDPSNTKKTELMSGWFCTGKYTANKWTEAIRPVGQYLTGCGELKLDLQAWTAERMIVTSVCQDLVQAMGYNWWQSQARFLFSQISQSSGNRQNTNRCVNSAQIFGLRTFYTLKNWELQKFLLMWVIAAIYCYNENF